MAKVIKLRKGLDVKLRGCASSAVSALGLSPEVALVPSDFVGLTPKVLVREGDKVLVGDPLMASKQEPEVKFVSPVSGTVSLVERGERRKVLSIRVKPDGKQEQKLFDTKGDTKALLLESGLFGFFRMRPYDVVASPADEPKAIFVSAFNSMPLAQDFEVALNGEEKEFQAGLTALSKLAPVHLGISTKQTATALTEAKDCNVTAYDGPAPAGNVGVHINHISPINKGEVVWTLGAEEVIFVGRLMLTGKVDLTRTIALAGSEVTAPQYYKVVVGQQIASIVEGKVNAEGARLINGNVMTGIKCSPADFLGAHATEINAIPEGDKADEFMGWIAPRLNTFSTSRTYLSWLMPKKEYVLDARIKGGERHMIMSGEYDRVLPMDIYGEHLIKAIITGDIDRQEALGIYEVAPEDFAIAEFVCSSKLELQRIVRQGLDTLRKENA